MAQESVVRNWVKENGPVRKEMMPEAKQTKR